MFIPLRYKLYFRYLCNYLHLCQTGKWYSWQDWTNSLDNGHTKAVLVSNGIHTGFLSKALKDGETQSRMDSPQGGPFCLGYFEILSYLFDRSHLST